LNHWPFIIAAYSLTALGTCGIALLAFRAMRHAERQADKL